MQIKHLFLEPQTLQKIPPEAHFYLQPKSIWDNSTSILEKMGKSPYGLETNIIMLFVQILYHGSKMELMLVKIRILGELLFPIKKLFREL